MNIQSVHISDKKKYLQIILNGIDDKTEGNIQAIWYKKERGRVLSDIQQCQSLKNKLGKFGKPKNETEQTQRKEYTETLDWLCTNFQEYIEYLENQLLKCDFWDKDKWNYDEYYDWYLVELKKNYNFKRE